MTGEGLEVSRRLAPLPAHLAGPRPTRPPEVQGPPPVQQARSAPCTAPVKDCEGTPPTPGRGAGACAFLPASQLPVSLGSRARLFP